jgi:hypothetical protein
MNRGFRAPFSILNFEITLHVKAAVVGGSDIRSDEFNKTDIKRRERKEKSCTIVDQDPA